MTNLAIVCKGCGKDVPADDVNIESGLAKCRSCHAVFPFADQVQARTAVKRGPVPLPRNIKVSKGPHELVIVRRWQRSIIGFFFAFFSIFWNLVISVFVVLAITGKGPKGDSGQVLEGGFQWLFLTPFILVGLATGYMALVFLFNRTRISLTGTKRLKVTHTPFRWFGHRDLDPSQISQLYCTEYVAYHQNNRPVSRMCVNALMKDGSRVELIKGIEEVNQAFYLEDLLEQHLRIEQRPVKGEYEGSHVD